jgi:hypothetical protein
LENNAKENNCLFAHAEAYSALKPEDPKYSASDLPIELLIVEFPPEEKPITSDDRRVLQI